MVAATAVAEADVGDMVVADEAAGVEALVSLGTAAAAVVATTLARITRLMAEAATVVQVAAMAGRVAAVVARGATARVHLHPAMVVDTATLLQHRYQPTVAAATVHPLLVAMAVEAATAVERRPTALATRLVPPAAVLGDTADQVDMVDEAVIRTRQPDHLRLGTHTRPLRPL